ncbi:MAG: CYTH domain-containing protein [Bacteroidota bacterium]
MSQEIEKKFLVRSSDFKALAFKRTRIKQGYLSSVPERTVRIRVRDEKGFITIKGKGNQSGASRYEWEKEIPLTEAEELLKICEPGLIDKTRYEIKTGDHIVEVDEFYGDNQGLVVAEIELENEKDAFEKPFWLGSEVTGDTKYYNSMLMKHPFTKW